MSHTNVQYWMWPPQRSTPQTGASSVFISSVTTEDEGLFTYRLYQHPENKTGYSSYSYLCDFTCWDGATCEMSKQTQRAKVEQRRRELAGGKRLILMPPSPGWCLITGKQRLIGLTLRGYRQKKRTMMPQRPDPFPIYITVLSNHFSSNVSESIVS